MAYVELHAHSHFSLLDGADHPETLVQRAAELGMSALALADHDNVYGAVPFVQAARAAGIRPVLGAELTLTGGYHLTLLVENEAGWHNLCYLISTAQQTKPKGQAELPFAELVGCTQGLIALSGCRQGEVATRLRQGQRQAAAAAARRYRDLFGTDHFWIELQRHHRPGDEVLVARLAGLANYLGLDVVATNNVHYARPARSRLQDVLVCIRQRTTLDQAATLLRGNSEFYLKSPAEMVALFAAYPEAVANTGRIAARCDFDLRYGFQDLPPFPTPGGMSDLAYLRRLCEEGLAARYPATPAGAARAQLQHELAVIERAGLANYFLIVAGIVRFARRQGIRCQGRGSAAGSLVAYLLHISPIDPLAQDLVFERFLSDERQAVPDIDLDFESERREEVIQYLYQTYGPAHVAMACTFVTFQARSAVREVGQVLGLPAQVVAAAAHTLEGDGQPPPAALEPAEQAPLQQLLALSQQLEDLPRHLGLHSGGMVLTGRPLMSRVPTEPAAMPGRVVVQWDKEALEAVGLVKIDVLGLRMLSAIQETVALVASSTGSAPALDNLPFDDPQVYEMIAQADTLGVFQVESRAQAQMLPKLRPCTFADLIVAISLIRPGPVQGNMVQPYLRRRLALEPATYLHPLLEPALKETLGVILFQEQVLKIARDLAGFTAGQGEQLRRALGAKRAEAALQQFREAFLAGAQAKGVPPAVAEQVFGQLAAFGSYSFAKSHAASFAVIVYQSAWLKRYHPTAFYTALLNTQPGFWPPAVLVHEFQRRGGQVRGVDIHRSAARCTLEGEAIRLGLNYVKGLGETHIERILGSREARPFADLADFCRRTQLGRRPVENLILAGAFDSWSGARRQLLWQLGTLVREGEGLDLAFPAEAPTLPPLSPAEQRQAEQSVLGLSTGPHLLTFYREWLAAQGMLDSRELLACAHGQRVQVAGLLVVHQAPPTAKGFHFLTLEDEWGLVNVVVRPDVYQRFRPVLRAARLLVVTGTVQQEVGVTNVLAGRLAVLDKPAGVSP